MIYPSADKLDNWGSRYALVVLAAKRAKQLHHGASPLTDTSSRNALTVALEEIAAGKVTCEVADTDIVLTAKVEPEVAQLLGWTPDSIEEEEEATPHPASLLAVDEKTEDEELDEEEDEDDEEEEDDDDEDEVRPLGIVEEPHEDLTTIPSEEPKPKRGRGRAAAAAEPVAEIEPDVVIDDIDEIEPEDEEEEESPEE